MTENTKDDASPHDTADGGIAAKAIEWAKKNPVLTLTALLLPPLSLVSTLVSLWPDILNFRNTDEFTFARLFATHADTCDAKAADPEDPTWRGVGVERIARREALSIAETCRKAIESNRGNPVDLPRLHYQRGRAYEAAGPDYLANAIEEYEAASRQGYLPASTRYGFALYRANEVKQAQDVLEAAERRGSRQAKYLLAMILFDLHPADRQKMKRADDLISQAARLGYKDAVNYRRQIPLQAQ